LAHHMLLRPGHNAFAARAGLQRGRGVPTARFSQSDERPLAVAESISPDTAPTLPPSAPDLATAIDVLPARHQQPIHPPRGPPARAQHQRHAALACFSACFTIFRARAASLSIFGRVTTAL